MARESAMEKRPAKSPQELVLESARVYEEHIVPILFDPWGRRLLHDTPVAPGQDVLDVACGSGAVSRLAAAIVAPDGTVTGLDLNEGMIETARNACKGVQPAIDLRVGDATDMPFEENRFDGVLCQQGVQFIPDKQAAINEMHRVLKPGGWLAFTVWRDVDHLPGFKVLCEALETHIDPMAGQVMRTPFSAGQMDPLREMATNAGFKQVRVTIESAPLRYRSAREFTELSIDATPPGPKGHLKSMFENVDRKNRDALFEEIERGLADHKDDNGVAWPMETLLVQGRK